MLNGGFFGGSTELIIEHDNRIKKFYYYSSYKNREEHIECTHYRIKNPKNNNIFLRYVSEYGTDIALSSDNYELFIYIEAPENKEGLNNKKFEINNIEALEQYLLGLKFPIAIDEVFSKVCELSLDSTGQYPKVTFEVTKKNKDNSARGRAAVLLSFL